MAPLAVHVHQAVCIYKSTKALSTQLMKLEVAVQRKTCAGLQAYTCWFSNYSAPGHSGYGHIYLCNLRTAQKNFACTYLAKQAWQMCALCCQRLRHTSHAGHEAL